MKDVPHEISTKLHQVVEAVGKASLDSQLAISYAIAYGIAYRPRLTWAFGLWCVSVSPLSLSPAEMGRDFEQEATRRAAAPTDADDGKSGKLLVPSA